MDAREVRRLADKGVLPGHQVGGEWRFNKAQMLDWLQREMHGFDRVHLENLERAMSDGSQDAVFGARLAPEAVDMNLPARSRASVLRELVSLAERTGLVYDRAGVIEALEDRENLCSTALPGGVAFPHPRRPLPYCIGEPLICLGRSRSGIPFGAPDGRLTDIFVLVCSQDEKQHLQSLARLSLIFHTDLADRLREIESNLDALELVLLRERELLQTVRDWPRAGG